MYSFFGLRQRQTVLGKPVKSAHRLINRAQHQLLKTGSQFANYPDSVVAERFLVVDPDDSTLSTFLPKSRVEAHRIVGWVEAAFSELVEPMRT